MLVCNMKFSKSAFTLNTSKCLIPPLILDIYWQGGIGDTLKKKQSMTGGIKKKKHPKSRKSSCCIRRKNDSDKSTLSKQMYHSVCSSENSPHQEIINFLDPLHDTNQQMEQNTNWYQSYVEDNQHLQQHCNQDVLESSRNLSHHNDPFKCQEPSLNIGCENDNQQKEYDQLLYQHQLLRKSKKDLSQENNETPNQKIYDLDQNILEKEIDLNIPNIQEISSESNAKSSLKQQASSRKVFDLSTQTELELEFRASHYLTAWKRKYLAGKLNLTERQVRVWFQNKRMRLKSDSKTSKRKRIQHPSPSSAHAVPFSSYQPDITNNYTQASRETFTIKSFQENFYELNQINHQYSTNYAHGSKNSQCNLGICKDPLWANVSNLTHI